MNELDARPLSLAASIGARMTGLDAMMAMTMTYGWNRGGQSAALRRDEFLIRASTLGLTLEKAEKLLRTDFVLTVSGREGSAIERLHYYAHYEYLTVLLGEVLTRDELAEQPFAFETALNAASWMNPRYGARFEAMDQDRQQVLVRAAIELTEQLGGTAEGWPLERAMAVVMPYQEKK